MGVMIVLMPAKPPTRFIPAKMSPPRRLLKINHNKYFKGLRKIMKTAVKNIMPNRKITEMGTFANKKSLPLNVCPTYIILRKVILYYILKGEAINFFTIIQGLYDFFACLKPARPISSSRLTYSKACQQFKRNC